MKNTAVEKKGRSKLVKMRSIDDCESATRLISRRGFLNGIDLVVNPSPGGTFLSPFACLSCAEKAAVFQIMDGTDSLKPLAGVLPAFVAFFCYSEAAVFDPVTRSLTGEPIAWELSSYEGVSDGRNEFL